MPTGPDEQLLEDDGKGAVEEDEDAAAIAVDKAGEREIEGNEEDDDADEEDDEKKEAEEDDDDENCIGEEVSVDNEKGATRLC